MGTHQCDYCGQDFLVLALPEEAPNRSAKILELASVTEGRLGHRTADFSPHLRYGDNGEASLPRDGCPTTSSRLTSVQGVPDQAVLQAAWLCTAQTSAPGHWLRLD